MWVEKWKKKKTMSTFTPSKRLCMDINTLHSPLPLPIRCTVCVHRLCIVLEETRAAAIRLQKPACNWDRHPVTVISEMSFLSRKEDSSHVEQLPENTSSVQCGKIENWLEKNYYLFSVLNILPHQVALWWRRRISQCSCSFNKVMR